MFILQIKHYNFYIHLIIDPIDYRVDGIYGIYLSSGSQWYYLPVTKLPRKPIPKDLSDINKIQDIDAGFTDISKLATEVSNQRYATFVCLLKRKLI